MAENVTSAVNSESGKAAGTSSLFAPPKFVFGQNTPGRVKQSPEEDEKDEGDSASEDVSDVGKSSSFEGVKRSASSEDEKEEDDSDKEGCLSPVKKMPRLRKSFFASYEHHEENKFFKLKPSMLSEVAKNLTNSSNKGDRKNMVSPVPKTVGAATTESSSTDNNRESGAEQAGGDTTSGNFSNSNSNYFQQFMQSGKKSPASSSSGGFVFGQNMGARVLFSTSSDSEDNNEKETQEDEREESELVGLTLCQEDPKTLAEVAQSCSKLPGPTSPTHEKEHRSLAEAAMAYQETVSTPKGQAQLAYVNVVTGEEEERNVLKVNCRLFVFDTPNHSWRERGRGVLRLNDMCQSMSEGIFQSRLVMRTAGSLRVVLNTKLWPQMTMEKANEKSLRITAFDSENDIKIYLVMVQ